MLKKNGYSIYLLAILPMIFWGYSFVWFKIAFTQFKPISVVFLRLLISSLLLITYHKLSKKKLHIEREDFGRIALLAFFEPFCYFMGESFGLTYVSATVGSIIVSTIPLVTPIFSHYFLKEKTNLFQILGLIISFLGVILLVSNGVSGSTTLKGVLLMAFAVFSAVGYGITLKPLAHKYSSFSIVLTQNSLALLYFLPFLIGFEGKHLLSVRPDPVTVSAIIKLAIFGSTLSFLLVTRVIRKIGLNNTNLFSNLIPVVTAVVAYFKLGESFPPNKIIGILVVLSGLFIAQYKNFDIRIPIVRR